MSSPTGALISLQALMASAGGKLKIAAVALGFFAMLFCSVAHDRDEFLFLVIHLRYFSCPKEAEFGRCFAIWTGQMCLSLVIMAWLITLILLVATAMPAVGQHPQFRKADGIGHIVAGVMDILAFIFACYWVLNLFLANQCDKDKNMRGPGSGFVPGLRARQGPASPGVKEEDNCLTKVLFQVCVDLFCQKDYDGPPPPEDYNEKQYSGHYGAIWLLGGVFGLVAGLLSIVVFLLLKKGPGSGMGMNAVHPTHYPGSQYPSQMTQQLPVPSIPSEQA